MWLIYYIIIIIILFQIKILHKLIFFVFKCRFSHLISNKEKDIQYVQRKELSNLKTSNTA